MSTCTRTRIAAAGLLAACLAAAPAGRPAKQIAADLQQTSAQLGQLRYTDSVKYNPLYKQQMGREYGPVVIRESELETELSAVVPKSQAAACRHLATINDAKLAFWGETGAAGRIDAALASTDPATATDGKLAQLLVRWWSAYGDADAQTAVVDDIDKMVDAAPASQPVADAVHLMVGTNPATVAIGQRLTGDLTVKLAKTPLGKSYAADPVKIDMPFAFDGVATNGKHFKTKDWAGKVVLVDFWATWCPPCRAGLPHVIETYQKYHDQGLEIVGVSSDNDRRALAAFVQANSAMAWPELFGGTRGWHPLTKKFGVSSIPTMYLIDRNGLLRTTEARQVMDKMIPELLAEPYTPAAPGKAK